MTLSYIDTSYTPTKNDLVCEYSVQPAKGISFETAAQNIAGETSIGTWTDISTMNPGIAKRLKPSVFYLNKKTNIIRIAYSEDLFEAGNMPEILSSIAGNIFGMNAIDSLRLEDISFPKSMINSFKGPKFGINGIRKLTRIKDRPLVGTIVKPKVGLTPSQHAKVAYNSWAGGLDVVKDDENLSSMKFNRFEDRLVKTLELRDRAEEETGEKKIYMPNITAETMEMLRRADLVKAQGGEYIMVDILTCGWSALQTVREQEKGMVIHAHRAMHGALTRNRSHGISMLPIAKIARLIGCDQLHIGTAVGKMDGSPEEIKAIEKEIESSKLIPEPKNHILEQDWHNIKPTLAVASGGLHPGMTAPLIKILGTNIVAQYGGGCHGHPKGTMAGAKAIRQSVDAAMKNIPLKEAVKMKEYTELKQAIDLWGC